jgi:conjugative relaxase-like TrwC/TraI family protein
MGADEVAYHQATVVGRSDDHPGAALDYYGSRGETPLRWAGACAARLGLSGEATADAYEAAFGPGGFRDPATGTRLVASKRPGFELVVSAHKSVAVLGVLDHADTMHSILDVETDATMRWLDDWFQTRGGRRGRDQTRTATGGLTYAVTRHATSRAGDPSPHDHVLVANVVEMLDEPGGFKALDSAALRDTVEAATMVGRLHSAWRAVEAGFRIEPDDGPSGKLRHWRLSGIPHEVCALFSKRTDEIAEHLAATGQHSYRARGIAARQTRRTKGHVGADELLPVWHTELETAGWPIERLTAHLTATRTTAAQLPFPLTDHEIDRLVSEALDVDGRLLARHKVFTRTHLIAELAPRLYGRDPAELDRVLDHITTSRDVVPLIGVAGSREQSYTTVEVLAAEQTVAHTVAALAGRPGPSVERAAIERALGAADERVGTSLTAGQRALVTALCSPDRAVTIVIGVAGSGKTTALSAAADALDTSGYRVVGVSTSGQAARNLGSEAHVEARTFASLLWRLDHRQLVLDDRTVVVVDEAGMADDANLDRLLLAVERAHAKLVLVGDPRQLDAVGPGGALAALIERHRDVVVRLDDNVRQRDADERRALAELRDGSVSDAIAWYVDRGRMSVAPTRIDTLVAVADAWATDVSTGHHTALLAWRRRDVADLNRLARDRWDRAGHLVGDDVVIDGRPYAVGDRIVALAPLPAAGIVTSERLTITALTGERIDARTDHGRTVTLTGEHLDREHLDHAYAVTVHRAQGATFDRAHVLAAGGGRELAYVALSRARDRTTIHITADELSQGIEDLRAEWGVERHQRWIIDGAAEPGHEAAPAALSVRPGERDEAPPDVRRSDANQRLGDFERDYRDLHAGIGRWSQTAEGAAARHLQEARHRLDHTRRLVTAPDVRRRERRAASRLLPVLEAVVRTAEQQWQAVVQPVVDQILDDIRATRCEIDRLDSHELIDRVDRLQRASAGVPERVLGRERAAEL